MDYLNIKSLGELKKSNWVSKSIKDELRDNLISIKKLVFFFIAPDFFQCFDINICKKTILIRIEKSIV